MYNMNDIYKLIASCRPNDVIYFYRIFNDLLNNYTREVETWHE